MHSDGSWKRNDYIGVDLSLPFHHSTTWIPEDVIFSLQKEDHRPLLHAWNGLGTIEKIADQLLPTSCLQRLFLKQL